ncbi:ABC transporter substrate-binding protein [Paenibacillus solanacearum]|uniref:ABC transporter substrate-binding protein n=1 Tax=Paenibacillus solanacearum TaxID=2048548 RepID=UPI001C40581A|nr:extracellular solute-binding protein [Paenibacillus solanacearum]
MRTLRTTATAAVTVVALLSAGCSQGQTKEPGTAGAKVEVPPEPITLKLYDVQVVSDEDLEILYNGPIKKKYPYITVEKIDRTKVSLQDVISTNQPFDLFTIGNSEFAKYEDLGFFEDITPLLNKSKLDLSRFDPRTIESTKNVSHGAMYGVPFALLTCALFYNKDIFDKFGVSYPKDGMTWDQVVETAKALTRQDSGVQYMGIHPEAFVRVSKPLGVNPVDPVTHKASVTGEPYKRAFELGKLLNDVSANAQKTTYWNPFFRDKTIGMVATYNILTSPFFKETEGKLNWDMVQYPSFSDMPNNAGPYSFHLYGISKTSKHKEAAAKVIELLSSDEVHMSMVRSTGRVSALKDPKFQQAYGADNPILKGKNIQAMFKSTYTPGLQFSKYSGNASTIMEAEYKNFLNNKYDVNTALRTAEEKINQTIAQELKK